MDSSLAWFGTVAALSVLVALFTRNRGWGMALPLIAIGAIVAIAPIGPDAPPDPEVVLVVILAPLVFGESLNSSYIDLRKVRRPVMALAIGLVLATTFAVGFVVAGISPIPLAMALALGAALAPTDAVAVSQVARRARLPQRLVSILEGESLVNDGTGLTLLRVAITAVVIGDVTLAHTFTTFVLAVVGGVGVGLVAGWVLVRIADRTRDAVASNSLILVAPFGIYLLAEQVEGSGVLAVVVAALMIAHFQTSGVEHSGRLQGTTVWRHLTFVLQAFAFFIVGMELSDTLWRLPKGHLVSLTLLVLAVTGVLIATRFVFVGGMLLMRRGGRSGMELRSSALLAWAGARGPVSGLAAFSIPLVVASGAPMPYRELVLATTFGVIVVTLLLSLTMAPLARLLGVAGSDEDELAPRVEAALAHAALLRLDSIAEEAELAGEPIPDDVLTPLQLAARYRIEHAHAHDVHAGPSHEQLRRRIERQMVQAEQTELLRLRDEGDVPDLVARRLQLSLDARAAVLRG